MPKALSFATAFVYYFSNPKPQSYYDYTFRVAANVLRGRIGFAETPPSWLNEFVPLDGSYYSVFPLGSVISMMPFAVLKVAGLIVDMPAAVISALMAAAIAILLAAMSVRYNISASRRYVMVAGILFGTWMWTNLTMAGAWQLALGFAMIGELGAIYFTVYDRRPLLAGLFFALAFGNRTEIVLTAPIFLYLISRQPVAEVNIFPRETEKRVGDKTLKRSAVSGDPTGDAFAAPRFAKIRTIAAFCAVPFVLGVLTLVYNYVRFHSFTDFGYSRIPGVLAEPWYDHGIFSLYYIPRQMWEMLWRPWEVKTSFPYLMPNAFSSSILWSSPFLLSALRFGARDTRLKYAAWTAIIALCFLLWIHGNSGGWQFGYRYGMICLPWIFVVLLETAPKEIKLLEWAAYISSFAANAYATWLFHWTNYLKP